MPGLEIIIYDGKTDLCQLFLVGEIENLVELDIVRASRKILQDVEYHVLKPVSLRFGHRTIVAATLATIRSKGTKKELKIKIPCKNRLLFSPVDREEGDLGLFFGREAAEGSQIVVSLPVDNLLADGETEVRIAVERRFEFI